MAKVRFSMDVQNFARGVGLSPVYDTVVDLGLRNGEWEAMSEEQRKNFIKNWMTQNTQLPSYAEVP